MPAVYGPKHFFFYSLYESDRTGAPLAVRSRALGSIDAYAAAVGRWLVTRDAFDLLVFYLPDYDYASHARGPDTAHEALARSDSAIAALMDAAGGPDEFLDRYALVVCSDHGQSKVEQTASARRGRRPRDGVEPRRDGLHGDAARGSPSGSTPSRPPGSSSSSRTGEVVARRDGDEDLALLDDVPDGRARAAGALRNPNSGEVLVSAAPGWEFVDLGGASHLGGGSHGSLEASRLRGADAVGRPRPAARVDHRDQGADRRALRCAGPSCDLTGSTASFAPAASSTRACSRRCAASRASSFVPVEAKARAYDDAALALATARRSRSRTSSR